MGEAGSEEESLGRSGLEGTGEWRVMSARHHGGNLYEYTLAFCRMDNLIENRYQLSSSVVIFVGAYVCVNRKASNITSPHFDSLSSQAMLKRGLTFTLCLLYLHMVLDNAANGLSEGFY